jgi:hypothetical protein
MSMIASVVLYGLALYAALGVGIGAAFVVLGVTRVLTEPATVTVPARLLLLPGAIALWPVVLRRWLRVARPEPRT